MNFSLSSLFPRRAPKPQPPQSAPEPEQTTPAIKWAAGKPVLQQDRTGEKLMFIPKPLSIEGMPLLRVLPANIMYAGRVPGGWASSLYIYDLDTLEITAERISMTYRNDVTPEGNWVHIQYDRKRNAWTGSKYIHGNNVSASIGAEWKNFFTHLTLLGLTRGEPCRFELPDSRQPHESLAAPR